MSCSAVGYCVRRRSSVPSNENMGPPRSEQVLSVLSAIQDPDLGRDVVSLGMIKDLAIAADGRVSFTFELTTPACPVRDRFQTMATNLLPHLPGPPPSDLKMPPHPPSPPTRPH